MSEFQRHASSSWLARGTAVPTRRSALHWNACNDTVWLDLVPKTLCLVLFPDFFRQKVTVREPQCVMKMRWSKIELRLLMAWRDLAGVAQPPYFSTVSTLELAAHFVSG